jgi:alkanesulfonate monooxygenase SsuD/methylene tetrahydromethanopterin reductase-like flavin-dependent oxidoreductase (luciferase family)
MTLANISKPPAQLAPQVEAYRREGLAAGHDPARLKVAIAAHCHIAPDSQRARDRFYPQYAAYFRAVAPKGSPLAEVPRELFEARAAATGPLFVGSPQEIIDKVLYERELFGHERFLAQVDLGALPYAEIARVIELLAADVAPALRRA